MLKKKIYSVILTCSLVASLMSSEFMPVKECKAKERKDNYIIMADNQDDIQEIKEKCKEDYQTEVVETCSKHGDAYSENYMVCELSDSDAEELAGAEDIIVEKDEMIQACTSDTDEDEENSSDAEWNIQMVRADDAQTKAGNEKIKVAVLDSGVDDFNDLELAGSINLIPGEEEVLPLFWDVTGHGSSVAGIIAAEKNDVGITGIAPETEIYAAKVLDDKNQAPVSRVIDGIYWAIEKNVNIINMSFGLKNNSAALHKAIKDAYNAGILLVAAAGNGNDVEYPAAYGEVIAVGSVDTSGTVSEKSATGEELELAAPGEQICSTGAFEGTLISAGTSMAAPHVTGIAARLWAKDTSVSSEFIRQLMAASANECGEKDSYGYGLVDLAYAEEIYDTFKANYISKNDLLDNIAENDAQIETYDDVEYVEGRWDKTYHQNLVTNTGSLSATNVSTIKKGIIFPDTNSNLAKLGTNPGFHGGGNYVLNAIYLSYLARDGKLANASNYFSQDVLNTYQSALDDMNSKLSLCQGSITDKYFLWGIALHSLSDSFSHNSVIQDPKTNQWYHLIHANSSNAGKTGYITEADNPYVARARYDSAQTSVDLALYELLKGNAWTFRVYEHESYFKTYKDQTLEGHPYYHWTFKMKNLFQFAKEIDYGANYSNILKQATY